MSLNLPRPTQDYNLKDQIELRQAIERAFQTVPSTQLAISSGGTHQLQQTFDGKQPLSTGLTSLSGFSSVGSWPYLSAPGSWTAVSLGANLSFSAGALDVVSAPKWTTARTLSFTGDTTGSGSIDGSGNVSIAMTGVQAAKLTTARTFSYTGDATGGPTSFDGSGNVSTALTLATVNANVGSFGDGTNVASFTTNAKGLITAASNVAITSAPKWTTARTLSFTGDVTGSGSVDGSANVATALTIANATVTLAKIANASASSKLLGSGASGSGAPYAEIALGSNLSMSGTTLSAAGTIPNAGGLIGIQVITATGAGTYTPTSGTNSIVLTLIGGGGGGGAVASPTGANAYLATGGQAGGVVQKRLTANFSGASYVVGGKGTGGAAGANNGNGGSDTTFTTTGSVTYAAKGGAGGTHNGAFAPPFVCGLPTPNITTDGDVAKSGELGVLAITVSLFNTVSGNGGNGPYGFGGGAITLASNNASQAGGAAGGHGGGGGGAVANGTGAAAKGGDGSDGLILICEYS